MGFRNRRLAPKRPWVSIPPDVSSPPNARKPDRVTRSRASQDGEGGIRTHVGFPPHRFRGEPVWPSPAPLQDSKHVGSNLISRRRLRHRPRPLRGRLNPGSNRVPPPSVGAPGFEPGTSATRTQRSTGLSHAPRLPIEIPMERASRQATDPRVYTSPASHDRQGFEARRLAPQLPSTRTTAIASHNGRGGIRTHAGFRPHDFQSCALSRSATRPTSIGLAAGKRANPTCNGGSGIRTHVGVSTQRLSRAPLLATQPSLQDGHGTAAASVAPLGLEPRLSGARIRRVASYTMGQSRLDRI